MRTQPSLIILFLGIVVTAAITSRAQTGIEIGFRGGRCSSIQSTENTGYVSYFRFHGDYQRGYVDDFAASAYMGTQFAAFVTFNVNSRFSVQPELIYTEKGVDVNGTTTSHYGYPGGYVKRDFSQKIRLSYVEIPVLVRFRLPAFSIVRSSLFAGPAVAIKLTGTNQIDLRLRMDDGAGETYEGTLNGKPDISNLNGLGFGLVVGSDLKILTGFANVTLDTRYAVDISEVYEDSDMEYFSHMYVESSFPAQYPVVNHRTGEASSAKNRVFSITLGVSFPL